MRSGGWKPFWAALFASLLVLVPLVGGTVLLSRQQLRTPLLRLAGASVLIISAPGSRMFLPAVPAAQAGALAHALAEELP